MTFYFKYLFFVFTECGKATKTVKKLISYASPEKFGEAPWHVAIYYVRDSTRPLICGGTLISPYLVVSGKYLIKINAYTYSNS